MSVLTAVPAHASRPTRPAAPSRPSPLRLTRRGRAVVVLALLAVVLVLAALVGHVSGSRAASSAPARTVVVQPGDTLWSIAARVEPGHDPRTVVPELTALNHLGGASLQVGERLVVPS